MALPLILVRFAAGAAIRARNNALQSVALQVEQSLNKIRQGFGLTVKVDFSPMRRHLKGVERQIQRAHLAAVNKVAAEARTAGLRELAKTKRIPVRALQKRTRLIRANQRQPYATLVTLTAGMPIDKLSPRALKRGGVSAAGQRFPHAFSAKMSSGHRGVYERKIIGGTRAKRLPLERVKIPLQPDADRIFARHVQVLSGTRLKRIFEQDLQRRIARLPTR